MNILLKFYFPNFSPKPYEKAIEHKLRDKSTRQWESKTYQSLLNLKNEATKAAASFSQLKGFIQDSSGKVKSQHLATLEYKLNNIIYLALQNNGQNLSQYKNDVMNHFAFIKNGLIENKPAEKSLSFFHLITNSLVGAVSLGAFGVACLMISTGPVGIIALGLGLAFVAGALVYDSL